MAFFLPPKSYEGMNRGAFLRCSSKASVRVSARRLISETEHSGACLGVLMTSGDKDPSIQGPGLFCDPLFSEPTFG